MTYPVEMQGFIKKVEASRAERLHQEIPKLDFSEKRVLLKSYHPDFVGVEKRDLRIGANKG
ncbi:succinate dehydrogenase/fumarate reductase flavoprotein subunit, partial [Thermodesulfobacteriota bacterium]